MECSEISLGECPLSVGRRLEQVSCAFPCVLAKAAECTDVGDYGGGSGIPQNHG